MAVSEESRHHLLTVLESTLGKEAAMTLAEHLPPVGWADVATRRDLDALRVEMHHRFEAMDHRFDAMDQRFDAMDRRFEEIDHRFEAIDHRFEVIDHRFEAIEHRFDSLEHRTDSLGDRLRAELHESLSAQTRQFTIALVSSVTAFGALVVAVASLG